MDSMYLRRWARLLTGYCLDLNAGKSVLISGTPAALPLIQAAYEEAILAGANPRTRIEPQEFSEFFLKHASDEQLAYLSPAALAEAKHTDTRLVILSDTNTRAMSALDPARQAARSRALTPARKLMTGKGKTWVLTLYPTLAYAQEADMSISDYEAFVAEAMFLDKRDPAAEWKKLGQRQAKLVKAIQGKKQVHIQGPGTDIEFSIEDRKFINSDGRRNMPSGEIFTGPVENSANGEITCTYPVCRAGREVENIWLKFRAGRVVEARATKNEEFLLKMLDTDKGSRRLGEFGIGLNYGIQRFTKEILFDEKIGGTIHLALGSSYPETGGKNKSALHWDLIVDLRKNGSIHIDGKRMMKNGKWSVT